MGCVAADASAMVPLKAANATRAKANLRVMLFMTLDLQLRVVWCALCEPRAHSFDPRKLPLNAL
jgi:hypothetical protein